LKQVADCGLGVVDGTHDVALDEDLAQARVHKAAYEQAVVSAHSLQALGVQLKGREREGGGEAKKEEDDDEPERWKVSYRAGNAHTPADVLVGALEDEQMHRRATAVRDFYHSRTYTVVPEAEHELWHSNYLHAIKAALDRLKP
jgi:hypothetical protein